MKPESLSTVVSSSKEEIENFERISLQNLLSKSKGAPYEEALRRIIALKLSQSSSGTGINTVEPSSTSEQYAGQHVNGQGNGYQSSSPKAKLSPRYGDHLLTQHHLQVNQNRHFENSRGSGVESSQSHSRPSIDTLLMQQRNALNNHGNNSNVNSPGNTVQSSLSPDTHYSQQRGRGRQRESLSRGRDGRLYSRDSATGGGGAFSETGTTTSNNSRPRSYSAPRSRYLRSSSKENFGYNKGLTPRNVAYDERWRARSNSPTRRHFSPSLLAKAANERILSTSRENETFETRLSRSISNYYIRQAFSCFQNDGPGQYTKAVTVPYHQRHAEGSIFSLKTTSTSTRHRPEGGNTSPSAGNHTFGSEKYDDSFCAKTFARSGYTKDISPSPGQYSPPNTQSHFFHGRSLSSQPTGGMGGTGGTSFDMGGAHNNHSNHSQHLGGGAGAGGGGGLGYGSSYGQKGSGTGSGMGVVGGLGLHLNTDTEYDMRAYVDGTGSNQYNGFSSSHTPTSRSSHSSGHRGGGSSANSTANSSQKSYKGKEGTGIPPAPSSPQEYRLRHLLKRIAAMNNTTNTTSNNYNNIAHPTSGRDHVHA